MNRKTTKLTIFVIVLGVVLFNRSMASAQPVHFADANLKQVVREVLGVWDPTVDDMFALTYLDAHNKGIDNLTGLEDAVNLTVLYLWDNQLSSISPLSGLTNLTTLWLSSNQISDISPLSGLTNLTGLYLHNNQINDISSLSGLTNLTLLSLGENQISDISPLSGLTNLTWLLLPSNYISDISPLSGLMYLTRLSLGANQSSDVSSLSGLTNLTHLYLWYNQIRDISPLSGLANLTVLGLSHNQISDISPLSGLTNLTELNLKHNQISDISSLSGLTNLTHLYLWFNQISDISPLSGLMNLTWLRLHYNPLNREAYCTYLPLIIANNPNARIYYDPDLSLCGCPPAQAVAVDIKPGSCPNPLNIKSKGKLPVAVLGTEDFDVTTIDPATIRLTREGLAGGVAPVGWDYQDVATPFEGQACDCHDLNGDGFLDLTLTFSTQDLVETLGLYEEERNTILPLIVTGNLNEENCATPIEGEDCIRILQPPMGDMNNDLRVDWSDFSIFSSQWNQSNCKAPKWCAGADLDNSGKVNWGDFAILAAHWLECTAVDCN